jgi:hypothetical protein
MPFSWFIYYLTPLMAIFAAVPLVFLADKVSSFYGKNKQVFRKNWAKIATISIILLLSLMLVLRSDTVYGKIMEASVYYSTTDIKAYDAGVWLKTNYPQNSTVVTTEIPGFWFQEFSGKSVIAQTDPTVQRNEIAESVLTLSYEIEQPQTLLKAYEAKGDIYEENYISIDQVWYRVSYSSDSANFLYFTQNGAKYELPFTDFSRTVTFENQTNPKKIAFQYTNDYAVVTETMQVDNSSYSTNVTWQVTKLKGDMTNVALYLTTLFDLRYQFEQVQIPGVMDWVNPYDMPVKEVSDTWATVNFTSADLKDSYLGFYDSTNDLASAFKFNESPQWGNIGALGNRRIDAVRFQYEFSDLAINQTVSRSYDVVSLSKNTFPSLQQSIVQGVLTYKPTPFTVMTRDYFDYIQRNDIGFIVYDRNHLDTQMIHSKILQLIYSNDRYVIFKILK